MLKGHVISEDSFVLEWPSTCSKLQMSLKFLYLAGHIPVILISAQDGRHLAALVDTRTKVFMEISIGQKVIQRIQVNMVKKSSVLFVSVSFIVLMTISLAWLVFYYIHRFRYAQARGKTQVSGKSVLF